MLKTKLQKTTTTTTTRKLRQPPPSRLRPPPPSRLTTQPFSINNPIYHRILSTLGLLQHPQTEATSTNNRQLAELISHYNLTNQPSNSRSSSKNTIQEQSNPTELSNFIPWAASLNNPPIHPLLKSSLQSLAKLTDIRRPEDLYPDARRYKRQIHLHVGPTNSGKTHSALRALHSAHTGVYAGPLRLLAHEVFTRINAGQIAPDLAPRPCNLLTGEEQRISSPTAGLTSCTVEMLSCQQFYDVVVIDEIQMIGDHFRGDAWTQAVLGVQAKELHLCGEESVVGLIESLANSCQDEFILHRYQRLTPLKVADSSLKGDLSKVQRGDCLVTFSRNNIYALKKAIQSATDLRVGMAYGGLPPEVREREAQMFNLGSQVEGEGGYDVLVGSDAIGMGLNLKIKRVVFQSLHKFDGRNEVALSTSQIKQIGGRAGRFGILPKNGGPGESGESREEGRTVGEVLTMNETDMSLLRRSMAAPFEKIERAVLKAPFTTVEGLARRAPPGVRYSNLLDLRRSLTLTRPEYAIGDEKNSGSIADALQHILPLSLSERDLFCSAPASARSPVAISALQQWANAHALRRQVDFLAWLRHENVEQTIGSIESSINSSSSSSSSSATTTTTNHPKQNLIKLERLHNENLLRLESIHKCLVLYLWLAFRLPESFVDFERCQELKLRTETVLGIGLNSI
ncbi:RNA helicase [Puccinia graminis f. sp. tritici]|uniref:RNA helicase n=1 Tax=Puccinia graminis f. sp. tritici TaxID=56615 RepID=A0A5B0R9P6_PUCGR|nr:RNA helicase [Puccinia graminis f. sp. tritici]